MFLALFFAMLSAHIVGVPVLPVVHFHAVGPQSAGLGNVVSSIDE